MQYSPRRVASYERNQYLVRCADRAVHDPAAGLEAQAETADHRVSIATNVSVLRTDHIATQSSLPGVWRGLRPKAVGGEMQKRVAAALPSSDLVSHLRR